MYATAPAEVYLSTAQTGPAVRHLVREGLTKLSHPLVAGESMRAVVIRGGATVAECAPERDGFVVAAHPETYNFNVYVAESAPGEEEGDEEHQHIQE